VPMTGPMGFIPQFQQQNQELKQLMNLMNNLTQGGLTTMSPDQLQFYMNRMGWLSHRPGQDFTEMAGMIQGGGQAAGAMGLNKQFGLSTALSSVAFGHAWADLAGRQGFGGLSREDAVSLDQRLRLSAAGSMQGNMLGAIANMGEQGLLQGIDTTTPDGKRKLQGILRQAGGMDRSQIQNMLGGMGVNANTVNRFFMSKEANQGASFRNGVADIVRGQQFREVDKVMDNAMAASVQGMLQQGGMNQHGAGQAGQLVAKAMREALTKMDPEILNNPDKIRQRNAILKNAAQGALTQAGIKMPDNVLGQMVAGAVTNLEQRVKNNPALRQFGDLGGLVAMKRDNILQRGQNNLAKADKDGEAMGKEAGQQRNLIRKIVDAVGAQGPGGGLDDVAKRVFNRDDPRGQPGAGGGHGGAEGAPRAQHIEITGELEITADGRGKVNGQRKKGDAPLP
jgi:hypothetical protein